jgi:hypothetical protein
VSSEAKTATSERCADGTVLKGEELKASPTFDGLRFMTLKELNAIPEEDYSYVVDGMLPKAGSSILYGKPKRGKSTMARQLAVAVSQGKPFLGRDTEQGLVMYIALEEKPCEIAMHFRLLGAEEHDPLMILTDLRGKKLEEVRQAIVSQKPVLVIVDTLAKFLHLPKINDYGPVNEAVRWIHDVSRDTGAHFMAVHHSKKGKEDDATDNMLGSTALAGAVDTLIALSEGQGGRTVATTQRYGDPLEETALLFDPVARSMSLGNTSKYDVEEQKVATRELLSQGILAFVAANPGCIEPDIVMNVEGMSERIKRQLRELIKDGRLRKEGRGVAGDPYRYYAGFPIEA